MLNSEKGQRLLAVHSAAIVGCDPESSFISDHRFGEETEWVRFWVLHCSGGRKFQCSRSNDGSLSPNFIIRCFPVM